MAVKVEKTSTSNNDESKKIDNTKQPTAPTAQPDDQNKSDNTEEGKKNKTETKKETKPTAPTAQPDDKVTMQDDIGNGKIGGGTVVCEYIGNGIWEDETGEKWSAKEVGKTVSQRKYPAEEYEKRNDLKFMVGYGSMKITVVQ